MCPAISPPRYIGRFAPSPTGPLHLGSVVAALASWLDARAAQAQGFASQWLVRIEDVDTQRSRAEFGRYILAQLEALGLQSDAPPQWQSTRHRIYQQTLDALRQRSLTYPCSCSRKDIEQAWAARGMQRFRFETLAYPGTCAQRTQVSPVRAWRLHTAKAQAPDAIIAWEDRRRGLQQQDVASAVGDFVLLRADGMWSYQLACVVDDALQGVTHIVRGEDLLDNTARQILLQKILHHPQPSYLHIPLALDGRGEKLSKSNGAPSIDAKQPLVVLCQAAERLGLPTSNLGPSHRPSDALQSWVHAWPQRYPLPSRGA
ncbi:tRNA glutamyl-Q(34) synthetase GluQRS [Corticibacter populi]|uniref:Glutamyl-Q tRNA(Asp) synthetase n=1 Tax=Corticibacter populi TaxID=1550736 RepID=A0A3M6QV88_9BURK|nr:tRNA glutamyl-Q(34) synthetase GluQRS [Corticibacter populi]RMX06944.1 tRNA glutamyl-Q(34) synthetase GluQRS [Corticibacter populi]